MERLFQRSKVTLIGSGNPRPHQFGQPLVVGRLSVYPSLLKMNQVQYRTLQSTGIRKVNLKVVQTDGHRRAQTGEPQQRFQINCALPGRWRQKDDRVSGRNLTSSRRRH